MKPACMRFHPLEQRMDEEAWWPDDMFQKLGHMGYLGMTIPEAYGGTGLDYLTAGMVLEVIAEANPSVAWSTVAHGNLCLDNIFRNANEAQRQRYVPALCRGQMVGGLAMTEPEAGSDAIGGMRTQAVRDGDDYILSGTKTFISNAPIADILLVYAKTDRSAGSKGVSSFILETQWPGFSVARKLDKMGWRGSPIGEIVFDDIRVPASNLLGVENRGVRVMMSGLDVERVMVAPLSLGTAQRTRFIHRVRQNPVSVWPTHRLLSTDPSQTRQYVYAPGGSPFARVPGLVRLRRHVGLGRCGPWKYTQAERGLRA